MSIPEPAPRVLTMLDAAAFAVDEVPDVELVLDVDEVDVVLVDVVEEETPEVAMTILKLTA